MKQYNNQWTVLERCLHHHTSAGLINEAGFLYANLPRIASRQRVGIMVGQCFAASKYDVPDPLRTRESVDIDMQRAPFWPDRARSKRYGLSSPWNRKNRCQPCRVRAPFDSSRRERPSGRLDNSATMLLRRGFQKPSAQYAAYPRATGANPLSDESLFLFHNRDLCRSLRVFRSKANTYRARPLPSLIW